MGIGDRLKGLLIQEEEEKTSKPPQAPPQAPTATSTVSTKLAPVGEDPKIVEALNSALAEKALAEYDFRKFMESQAALQAILPDEATRFKATFDTIKSMGVTKVKLLETAKHYLTVLESEKAAFMHGVESQFKGKVASAQTKIKEYDTSIETKNAEVKRILEELETIKTSRDSLATQSAEWQSKIETTKSAFESVSTRMRTQIEQNMQKISTYLE